MSIYHHHIKPISRATGRSATGAAAYRAACVIVDQRTGVVHDYDRKAGVDHAELILPGGGTADRAEFWNRVELHHKRGDAVLVREVEIALPSELTPAERKELAVGYGRELSDRYGVAADVALHAPRTVTDAELEKDPSTYYETDPETGRRHNGNWHAHIMLTACSVQPDGTLGKKVVELDPIHCQRAKVENIADRERARWADLCNGALERAGHDARVDHRTLAAQGIDREPTKHKGPALAGMERRGADSYVLDNRAAEAAEQAQAQAEQAAQAAQLEAQILAATIERQQLLAQRNQEQAAVRTEAARLDGMTADQVRAEVKDLWTALDRQISQQPGVQAADQALAKAAKGRTAAETRAERAGDALTDYTERHPWLSQLSDRGLLPAALDRRSQLVAEAEQAKALEAKRIKDYVAAVSASNDAHRQAGEALRPPVAERAAALEAMAAGKDAQEAKRAADARAAFKEMERMERQQMLADTPPRQDPARRHDQPPEGRPGTARDEPGKAHYHQQTHDRAEAREQSQAKTRTRTPSSGPRP